MAKKPLQFALNHPIPQAEKKYESRLIHDHELIDEYGWLRAENWQQVLLNPKLLSPAIRTYLEQENDYVHHALKPLSSLRKHLKAEMRGRIRDQDDSLPEAYGAYFYQTRYVKGADHPQFVRWLKTDNSVEVMLDVEQLAKGKRYFNLTNTAISPCHRYLAYAIDVKGNEVETIFIKELETGSNLKYTIKATDGQMIWASDSSGLFYLKKDTEHRANQLFFHRIDQPQSKDKLLYHEVDNSYFLSLSKARAGEYFFLSVHESEKNEIWAFSLNFPHAKPEKLIFREEGNEYEIDFHPNFQGKPCFIALTNADAEDYRLIFRPVNDPVWHEFIPHRQGVLLNEFVLYQDMMITQETENALPRINIHNLITGKQQSVHFEEEAYDLDIIEGIDFNANSFRFSYSSLRMNMQIYEHDFASNQRQLIKSYDIPSGHNPDNYITKRLIIKARDSELIPVSLLYKKELNFPAPLSLEAYGSYGYSFDPSFDAQIYSQVNRGVIYAIAHIRGGMDKGYNWYKKGKLEHKTNSFNDTIDTVKSLIQQGYCEEKRVVFHGGSAGGMLAGVIANEAPELFAGIIARVPFVDVLNTMLDASLPLTPPEWNEWGNPIVDKEAFLRLKSYSPYDNIKQQDYPIMFVLGGLTDPRVTYWEPAKYVAKLRALKTGDQPILFHTHMDAGHSGASGRYAELDETVLIAAFTLTVLGQI